MAFGRRRRSLTGTAVRTAVITGTAAATANAVDARAQRRSAGDTVKPDPGPALPTGPASAAAPVAPAAVAAGEDLLVRLERLASLHASGALTDEEFTLMKSREINGGAS